MAALTLDDFNSMLSVIDVCSKRGAFKPQELEGIGKLYNNLTVFIQEFVKKSNENSEQETLDTDETPTSTHVPNNSDNVNGGHSINYKNV